MVNEKIGLSPGKVGIKVSERRDNRFLKRKQRASSKEFKKRRVELKQLRSTTTNQREVREGTTYQPSVCLHPIDNVQLVTIPPPTVLPPLQTISNDVFLQATCCVFDLETTSLYDNCDIVQISAITMDGEYSFDKYVLPNADICAAASRVNGMTKKGNSLFSHGKLVPTVSITESLSMFSEWLTNLNDEVVLFGHNIKAFDIKHFLRHVKENKMGLYFDKIVGFIDTLPMLKSLYPNETSYSQVNLYQRIVGGEYNAHNSLDDVKALAKLLRFVNTSEHTLCEFSITSLWAEQYCNFLSEKKRNVDSYNPLLQRKVLSKCMIDKAASSGLTYEHLKIVFVRDGEAGLRSLFSEEFEGKVRVTKSNKKITSVAQYFNSLS